MTTTLTTARNELLEQLITRAGSARVRCDGGSMEPTVRVGTDVEVRPCDRPRPGDVVLFRNRTGLVLHRVLWYIKPLDRFVHIGDCPGARAGIASCDQILGVATVPRQIPGLAAQWSGLRYIARAAAGRIRRAAS